MSFPRDILMNEFPKHIKYIAFYLTCKDYYAIWEKIMETNLLLDEPVASKHKHLKDFKYFVICKNSLNSISISMFKFSVKVMSKSRALRPHSYDNYVSYFEITDTTIPISYGILSRPYIIYVSYSLLQMIEAHHLIDITPYIVLNSEYPY